jgi:predicted phage baseplate assembly protein
MTLAAQTPVIDNRSFDDIVAEAKTRIPRYTPEWTDFNPGDAGFALVELFAWMTDLLIYRLGQVPQLNYIKFLQLIGIELNAAMPAQTVFVFPVQPTALAATVAVPARTQVSAGGGGGTAPIVFETNNAITALQATLDALLSYDGFAYADVTSANAKPGAGFQPFGALANAGSALLLGFKSTLAFPGDAELSLAVWPATDRGIPPPQPCTGGAAAIYAPAQLVWEYWAGNEWLPLKALSDSTLAFTLSGFVTLKLPAAGQAVPAKLGGRNDAPRVWLRARVASESYEITPALTLLRANAVAALAVQTVQNEVVGGSNGTPNQSFTLSSAPVLDGSLVLTIDQGSGPQTWRQVDDFAGSGPNDQVYLLDPGTGTITLGDGKTHGLVPVVNLSNPAASIVAKTYRFGGGASTNIAAGRALTLMTSLPGIDAAKVTSPFAAFGGTDEESLPDAMARAPAALQSQDRAVTAADFELLAKQAGPISRAHAMPLANPNFPGMQVPGVVTVVVVPDVDSPAPMPSPGLLRTVCAYLDQRRLITTELFVVAPTYVPVAITLQVLAQPDADTAQVELAVEAAIGRFLDPRLGGAAGTGWPFGGTIHFVEVLRAALVNDVIRVADLVITLNGTAAPACTDVPVPAGNLLSVQSVTASVTTDPSALGATA